MPAKSSQLQKVPSRPGTRALSYHPGQIRVLNSTARITLALAGVRAGKTQIGPGWMLREIKQCGPGDYMVVAPTYGLLEKASLPKFRQLFERDLKLGAYRQSPSHIFKFDDGRARQLFGFEPEVETNVFFMHATDPEALEAATIKAAWLDECFAPEVMVATEIGPIPIGRIVNERMRVRVWSKGENSGWELRPITRWIRNQQRQPLVKVGPLRMTPNHRIWTERGYVQACRITSACYNSSNTGVIHVLKMHALPQETGQGTKEVLQSVLCPQVERQAAVSTQAGFGADESSLCRSSESGSDCEAPTGKICGPGQTALESTGRGIGQDAERIQESTIEAGQERQAVDEGRERPSAKLEAGEVSEGTGMGERVGGKYGWRLAAPCVQDRRGRSEVADSDRGWQHGQQEEAGLVRGEWVDLSAFHESDRGGVDGGRSSDGSVYNLEVEENHNYVAGGILVANCGQKKFKYASYEAIMRRLSFDQGRALLTTTPYNMGWLKTEIFDRWKAGDQRYNVVRFSTLENPFYPKEEYDHARLTMPGWKFNMFYRGLFQRPAGLIYESFNADIHSIDSFSIPKHWRRYVGVDFGGVNTAATFWAEDPSSKRIYCYREYHAGQLTAKEHAERFRQNEFGLPTVAVGGSKSEGQWRNEFRQAGYPIREPDVTSVELGIDRVFGLMKQDRVYVFKDKCPNLLDELASYSRVLDDHGEPTEEIEDKEIWHIADSLRYIGAWYARLGGSAGIDGIGTPKPRQW